MGDLSVDCWTHSCKWSYVSHYSWWPTGGFNHEVEVLSIRWCLWWVRALLRGFVLLWWANWILHHHDLIQCYSHWQLEPHAHRFTLISHNLEWIDTHALLACIVTMLCTSHLHVMQEAGWWGLPGLKPLVFWAVFCVQWHGFSSPLKRFTVRVLLCLLSISLQNELDGYLLRSIVIWNCCWSCHLRKFYW